LLAATAAYQAIARFTMAKAISTTTGKVMAASAIAVPLMPLFLRHVIWLPPDYFS
jgi:hypothetical protein